jgi:hypothetical protein
LAFGAKEFHVFPLLCRHGILYDQKELSALSAKFFFRIMLDVALRTNDHFLLAVISPFLKYNGRFGCILCAIRGTNYFPQISGASPIVGTDG